MNEEKDTIYIRATAKRNSLTSLIVGGVLLILSLIIFKLLPDNFFILGIFATTSAIVALLIGWFKIREPGHSLALSKTHINYHHRAGNWQLDWDNVQRIDTPKVQHGLEQTTLTLVGIRIKDYVPLLENISPRLMTRTLMEQRALLLQAPDPSCNSGTCYSDDLIENDHFKTECGKSYKGVQAMYANRMQKLRQRLGYDLFINAAELDRTAEEFVTLLRSCQETLRVESVESA